MGKNYKLNNLAKLHAIQNMMEGHSEIEGQKLPNFLIDFFKDIEHDLEVLEHLKLLFNGYKILAKNGIKYKDMYLICKNGDDDLIKEWLER